MSKYPITNFIDQFEQAGAWKYGYFMIEKDNTPYYFYLIHTSSPVSKFDFFKRNQQLNTIKEDFFANHDKERDPNAKIIMCSAMGQQAMVIEAIQAGARDFIVKPFQADRVLEAVRKAVG